MTGPVSGGGGGGGGGGGATIKPILAQFTGLNVCL